MSDETPTAPSVEERAAKLLGGQNPAAMEPAPSVAETVSAPAVEISPAPVAEVTTTETDAPTASELQTWQTEAGELGIEGVESEEEYRERLVEVARSSREQQAQYAREMEHLRYLAAIGQQHVSQQAAPKPEVAPTTAQDFLGLPQFDMGLFHRFREKRVDPVTNEERVVWKEDTPASVRASGEAYQAALAEYHDQLLYNPRSFFEKLREEIKQALRPEWEQWTNETQTKQTEQQTIAEIQANAPWLYEMDPFTKQPVADFNGNYRYSAKGQAVMAIVNQLEAGGLKDLRMQWTIANQIFGSQSATAAAPAPPAAPPEAPQATRERKQREHLAKALPSRAGTVQPNGVPKNGNINGGKRLLQHMGIRQ